MRTFIFFLALLSNSGFSQSKKSQIDYLSFQIDSVKMVQINEQKIAVSIDEELNSTLRQLNTTITALESNLQKLKKDLDNNKMILQQKEAAILNGSNRLQIIQDSLTYFQTKTRALVESNIVQIGNQFWSTHNLNVSSFQNGDPILEAKTDEEWARAGKAHKPAWCYYENDPSNGAKYGKLYNSWAVNDPKGLIPEGYRIAQNEDWEMFRNLVCFSTDEAYNCEGARSKSGWEASNANGTDKFNLELKPGGSRSCSGYFGGEGTFGYWFSGTGYAMFGPDNNDRFWDDFGDGNCENGFGFAIRCIKK
jgi:uncharacterized protein (TIGR02145 family)